MKIKSNIQQWIFCGVKYLLDGRKNEVRSVPRQLPGMKGILIMLNRTLVQLW